MRPDSRPASGTPAEPWTRPALALLTGITLLGLGLRLIGLDRRSVWFDEAVSFGLASLSVPDLLAAVAGEANPPLSYLLLAAWLRVAPADDFSLRLPSALLGAACVPAAGLLGGSLFGPRVAVLAALLTAVAPFQVDLSQEARGYALLSLLATLSPWLLWHATTRGGRAAWTGYVVVTALALYTHYYAFLLVAAEAEFLAFVALRARRLDWRPVAALTAVALLFVPWLPVFTQQLGLKGDYWIERPRLAALWDTYRAFIFYSPPGPAHDSASHPLLAVARWVVLALLGAAAWTARRDSRVLLPLAVVVVPLGLAVAISLWLTPVFTIRYMVFAVPAFCVLLARGLDLVRSSLARIALAIVVVASVAINLPPLYADPYYDRADLRSTVAAVQSAAEPSDLVIHTRLFTWLPFERYHRGALEETLLPEGDRVALADALTSRRRAWYVLDHGLTDPAQASAAEDEARAFLALDGWRIAAHLPLRGVHLFRLERVGPS